MARTPVYSGKVRDIYAAGDDKFLFVASDRLSVFDVVLNEPVPDKGRILTGMTHYWLERAGRPRAEPHDHVRPGGDRGRGRRARTRRRRPGDAREEGRHAHRRVHRARLHHRQRVVGVQEERHDERLARCPPGIQESEKLPEPVFTPSTKAEVGDHDINITFDESVNIIGKRERRAGA